jgi:hypothetical protein
MLTITGTLRQSGELTIKEKPFVKLWVECETERENGPADLQILELLVPATNPPAKIPERGKQVSVDVRAYANGRNVAFSALAIRSAALSPEGNSKRLEGAFCAK